MGLKALAPCSMLYAKTHSHGLALEGSPLDRAYT